MTDNHHTPHAFEEELTSPLQNAPLGQLDSAITNLLAGALAFSQIRFASPTELEIIGGAITVTQSYHTIETEGGAPTDNLDTINGGAAGDVLFIQAADATHTPTIRHNGGGTGNIRFWDGGNLDLDETYKILAFLFDGTTWNYIGTIPTGSGAPSTATYITQTPDAGLSNEQALSLLATGIMHSTTTTGVVGVYKTNSTTTDPTTGDDSGDGYSIGSRWINTSTDKEFIALDVSVGAAVWKETTASGSSTSRAILRDEKAANTSGGASTSTTWNARDLNTELSDPDSIVTISSNKFIPISGTYIISVQAAAGHNTTASTHRLRLFNVTGAASVEEGVDSRGGGNGERTLATLVCRFTANGTDEYRIDHYTQTGQATSGLGSPTNDGTNEVYMQIELEKVA